MEKIKDTDSRTELIQKIKPLINDTKNNIKNGTITDIKKDFQKLEHITDINMNGAQLISDIILSIPVEKIKDSKHKLSTLAYESDRSLLLSIIMPLKTCIIGNDSKHALLLEKHYVKSNEQLLNLSPEFKQIANDSNQENAIRNGIKLYKYVKNNLGTLAKKSMHYVTKHIQMEPQLEQATEQELKNIVNELNHNKDITPSLNEIKQTVRTQQNNYNYLRLAQQGLELIIKDPAFGSTTKENQIKLLKYNDYNVDTVMKCIIKHNLKDEGKNLFNNLVHKQTIYSIEFNPAQNEHDTWSQIKEIFKRAINLQKNR